MITVPSSGGVEVALHRLSGSAGSPPLLFAHATGFNAHCYTPIARAVGDRFDCRGLDFRGHGATAVNREWSVDWRRFGDDALAAAHVVSPDGGVVGFGHSMGGAALLMAAHREPGLFERLVLFEPISHQATTPALTEDQMRQLPIVQGALRRTRRFDSFDAAYANYSTKPPLSLMLPEALRNYVDHGFRTIAEPESNGGAVELRCSPELEAAIFVTGRENGVWELLSEIDTPCVVAAGRPDERQPSGQAAAIAERLPHGTYVRFDDQDHFGPFSHPDATARLLAG